MTEFFVEAAVPLIENLPFVQNLSAELGYRYSDYNLSGTQSTWKAGLNYRPIQELKLRGGFNRAVRAPNVVELFRPQSNGLWNGSDPCAGANPLYSAEQCARTGVDPSRYGSGHRQSGRPVQPVDRRQSRIWIRSRPIPSPSAWCSRRWIG